MNSKKIVIIIAVVLVVTISAGFVIASQQQNPDGRQQSDRSSTVPVNSPVPTLITKSEDLLQQSLADPTVEKTSPIATEKARDLARKNFPEIIPDRVNITYNPGDRTVRHPLNSISSGKIKDSFRGVLILKPET
jgi:flagellar basal body-associated protein FliL